MQEGSEALSDSSSPDTDASKVLICHLYGLFMVIRRKPSGALEKTARFERFTVSALLWPCLVL